MIMVKVKVRTGAFERWLYDTSAQVGRNWDFGDFLNENEGKVAEMDEVEFYHLEYDKIKSYIEKVYDDDGEESAVL